MQRACPLSGVYRTESQLCPSNGHLLENADFGYASGYASVNLGSRAMQKGKGPDPIPQARLTAVVCRAKTDAVAPFA